MTGTRASPDKPKRAYSKPNRARQSQTQRSKPLFAKEKKEGDGEIEDLTKWSDIGHTEGQGVDLISFSSASQSPALALRGVMESPASSQSEKIQAAKALAVIEMRDGVTGSQAFISLTRDHLRAEITRLRGLLGIK